MPTQPLTEQAQPDQDKQGRRGALRQFPSESRFGRSRRKLRGRSGAMADRDL